MGCFGVVNGVGAVFLSFRLVEVLLHDGEDFREKVLERNPYRWFLTVGILAQSVEGDLVS